MLRVVLAMMYFFPPVKLVRVIYCDAVRGGGAKRALFSSMRQLPFERIIELVLGYGSRDLVTHLVLVPKPGGGWV